ncbi:MAG: hypothetical protein WDN27_02850 [Candidatus Saccharibacteria bacterium]
MRCEAGICENALMTTDEARGRLIAKCALAEKEFPGTECPLDALWEKEEAQARAELAQDGIINEDGSKGPVDEAEDIIFAAMQGGEF